MTGAEALNLAVEEIQRRTPAIGKKGVVRGAYQFARSGKAGTKMARKNRRIITFGGKTKFYHVFRRGGQAFRVYIPRGNARGVPEKRREVAKRWKAIRGRGFAKVSWIRMFGKIASGSGNVPVNQPKGTTPAGTNFNRKRDPKSFVEAEFFEGHGIGYAAKLKNAVEYISQRHPTLENKAAGKAALSLLGSVDSDLKTELKKVFGKDVA
jgi:hypothetical protein